MGAERKKLVGAISEILNTPMKYLGALGFGYEISGYTVDKNGTVSGERDDALLTALAEREFTAEIVSKTPSADEPEKIEAPDRPTIKMPMDGFMPKKLENLKKLVNSKATLIRTTLGVDGLPIESVGGYPALPLVSRCSRWRYGKSLRAVYRGPVQNGERENTRGPPRHGTN